MDPVTLSMSRRYSNAIAGINPAVDILTYKDACAVVSYWGWIKRSNSYRFYNQYVKPIVSIGDAKRAVSAYATVRTDTGQQAADCA